MPTIAEEMRARWKKRPKASHKGDFGRVFILAGSEGFSGAAHLTSAACVRSGAGLVTLGVPEKIYPVLARRESEVMVKPFLSTPEGTLHPKALGAILNFAETQDVIALGPGLSRHAGTQRLVREIVLKTFQPLVIDADGLNAFRGKPELLKKSAGRTLLTPHPGEFVRLFGGMLRDCVDVRKKRAGSVAKAYGAVVLLKGYRSVIASPGGLLYVNATGNPGMATGGTGDVLTGILASLIGQKFSLWDSARYGAYIHGLAGDLAARRIGQVSLKAGDLTEYLPQAFKRTLRW